MLDFFYHVIVLFSLVVFIIPINTAVMVEFIDSRAVMGVIRLL